jgi:hypothetical protein
MRACERAPNVSNSWREDASGSGRDDSRFVVPPNGFTSVVAHSELGEPALGQERPCGGWLTKALVRLRIEIAPVRPPRGTARVWPHHTMRGTTQGHHIR